jgi:hypothetical protein
MRSILSQPIESIAIAIEYEIDAITTGTTGFSLDYPGTIGSAQMLRIETNPPVLKIDRHLR